MGSSISIIYPLHVSNTVTIHHQEAVTVYAAYGIYHASRCIIWFFIIKYITMHCPETEKFVSFLKLRALAAIIYKRA